MDLTIYMDVSRNPGPSRASSLGLKENCLRYDLTRRSSFVDSHIAYSQGHLYSLRKSAAPQTLSPTLISTLKNLGLFRACSKRAGRLVRLKRAKQSKAISVIINSRQLKRGMLITILILITLDPEHFEVFQFCPHSQESFLAAW